MKLIPLELLIASARPLPWPVNARVEEQGALSFGQLEATRILRRHAANSLPPLVKAFEHVASCQKFRSPDEHQCAECAGAHAALDDAKNVRVES